MAGLAHYLKVCALEKRGKHSIGDIVSAESDDALAASPQDVAFVKAYLRNAIVRHADEEAEADLKFALAFALGLKTNTMQTHLTRDYQVIETGSHYVKLMFRTHTPHGGGFNNIKFCARFRPHGDADLLLHNDSVRISYTCDTTAPPPSSADCGRHMIRSGRGCDGHTVYRHDLFYREAAVTDPLLSNLPDLIDANYAAKADMAVEACCIA